MTRALRLFTVLSFLAFPSAAAAQSDPERLVAVNNPAMPYDVLVSRLDSLGASGIQMRLWGGLPGRVPGLETVSVDAVRNNPALVDAFVSHHETRLARFHDLFARLKADGYFVLHALHLPFGGERTRADLDSIRADARSRGVALRIVAPGTPLGTGEEAFPMPPLSEWQGQAYLHGRGIARRLGPLVDLFNIGPEINTQAFWVLWGWTDDPVWADWRYIREYVRYVHQGIKDERPSAVTSAELQATVARQILEGPVVLGGLTFDLSLIQPDLIQDLIGNGLIGETLIRNEIVPRLRALVPEAAVWTDDQLVDIVLWHRASRPAGLFEAEAIDLGGLTDEVSFQIYPHYVKPVIKRWIDGTLVTGVHGTIVGDVVRRIAAALPGKRIFLSETGYPAGPEALGFTPARQAQYVADAMDSAYDAGVDGFTYFHLYQGALPTNPDLSNPKVVEGYWPLFVGTGEQPAAAVVRDRFARWTLKRYTVSLAAGMHLLHVPLKPPSADYRAKNLMADLGADWLIFYDPAVAAFNLVTPADPDGDPRNVAIEGDGAYILSVKQPVTHTFRGSAWPGQIELSSGSYDLVGLPVRPAGGTYLASRLLNDTGASFFVWRDAAAGQWKSYFPGFPDFELTGDLGYLLIDAPAGTLTLPGAPWEN